MTTRPHALRPSLVLALAAISAYAAPEDRLRNRPPVAQPDPSALSVTVQPIPDPPAATTPVAPPAAPREHDQAALDLLELAQKAIAELTSFRSTITARGTSIFKGTTDEGSAQVLARRDDEDPTRWHVRITGPITPERESDAIEIDATFDGDRMKWIDRDDHSIGARVLPIRIQEAWFAVPDRLRARLWVNPDPFANELASQRLSVQPRETVDGVECDVLRADMGGGTYFLLFLGVQDHLPRRSVRGFDSRGTNLPMTGTETLEYTRLQAQAAISDDAFVIALPEGYREEKFPDEMPPATTPDGGILPPGTTASTVTTSEGSGAVATASNAGDEPAVAPSGLAPDFGLKDEQGKPVRLADFRGKNVLVFFWASWNPWAAELARELRLVLEADPELTILVLAVRERSPDVTKQKFEAMRLSATLLGGADDVAAQYEVGAVPTLVLVGPDGRILMKHAGFDPQNSPITRLRSLLANQ